jgi:hypothetical protein
LASTPFGEHVIKPALHPQENAPDNCEHRPVVRVSCDLADGACGQIVWGQIIEDIDVCQRAARAPSVLRIDQIAARLELSLGDRVGNSGNPPSEDAAGNGIEGDLSLVAYANPLQGILLKRGRKDPVFVMNENENGLGWRGDKYHSWPEQKLGHIAAGRSPRDRLLKLVLGSQQLTLQACHRGIDAIDLRFRLRAGHGRQLPKQPPSTGARFKIAARGVKGSLRHDLLCE